MPGPRGAFERVVTWAFVGLVAAMLLYPARAAVVPEGRRARLHGRSPCAETAACAHSTTLSRVRP